jgi:XRE family aerobic/anaerobic benzoate catabolism transcriptional regulator
MQRVINQGDLRPMRGNPRSMDDLRLILSERERDYALADEQLDTSGREIDDCLADLVRLSSAALTPTPSRN